MEMNLLKVTESTLEEIDTYFDLKSQEYVSLYDHSINEMDLKSEYLRNFHEIGECLCLLSTEKLLLKALTLKKEEIKGNITHDLKFKNGMALKKGDMEQYVYKNENWVKIKTAFDYQEDIVNLLTKKYDSLHKTIYSLKELREYHKLTLGMK
jgi:hypothetical protein